MSILNLINKLGSYKKPFKYQPRNNRFPDGITTDLTAAKKVNVSNAEAQYPRGGDWYMLEIVRPATQDGIAEWCLDGMRNVNGISRPVSTQRMYVHSVIRTGGQLQLQCSGVDNFGRREDGLFVYYQTPDSQNERETYILSIKPAN